ncbi:hypothetical protein NHF46_18445 [Arthrobacter alpinus]|nr:hypothetical protein [Arthrobacter alpinus]
MASHTPTSRTGTGWLLPTNKAAAATISRLATYKVMLMFWVSRRPFRAAKAAGSRGTCVGRCAMIGAAIGPGWRRTGCGMTFGGAMAPAMTGPAGKAWPCMCCCTGCCNA